MANRIYMYTVAKIPTVVGGEGFKNVGAKALYEYPQNPTAVSNILTGARFVKQAPSLLWKETTAAVSDFNEGVKLLSEALPYLIQILQGIKFEVGQDILQNMQMVLNKQKGRFILTEFTEVSQIQKHKAKQINKLNIKMTKNAIKFSTAVKKIVRQRNEKKIIKQLFELLQKNKYFSDRDLGLLGFTNMTHYGP